MAATDFQNGRLALGTTEPSFLNKTGSAIPAGTTVKVDTGNAFPTAVGTVAITPTTAVTDYPLGVTVEAIPNGQAGKVATIDGTFVWAIAAGAITNGVVVGPSGATAGAVTAYTATDPSLGIACSAAAALNDPIFVMLAKSRNA